jgi:hypothetical protein
MSALEYLHQQALGERLGDEIVGAHFQAKQFIDLFILRGEEDHRNIRLLAQPAQKLHAVHARHLDIENRKLRRTCQKTVKGGSTVGIGFDLVALVFQGDGNRGQDVPVVVDQCNRLHCISLHVLHRQADAWVQAYAS